MNIKPLHDKVLVLPKADEEQKSEGGIIIPDTAREKPSEGEVMVVGRGKRNEYSSVDALDVKVGDKLRGIFAGAAVKTPGFGDRRKEM